MPNHPFPSMIPKTFEQALKEYGLEIDNSNDDDQNYRCLFWDKEKEEWVVEEMMDYSTDVIFSGSDKVKAIAMLVQGTLTGVNY